jgi:hypothetical protein
VQGFDADNTNSILAEVAGVPVGKQLGVGMKRPGDPLGGLSYKRDRSEEPARVGRRAPQCKSQPVRRCACVLRTCWDRARCACGGFAARVAAARLAL